MILQLLEFAFTILAPLLVTLFAFVIYYSITEGVAYTNKILIKYKGIIGILGCIATTIAAIIQILPTIQQFDDIESLFQIQTHKPTNHAEKSQIQPYSTVSLDNGNNIVIQMGFYQPVNTIKGIISGYQEGAYRIESVEGAMEIVDKTIKTVNTFLYKHKENYQVNISIFGVEDASNIKRGSKYDDREWGHIAIPYYNDNAPDSLCVKHFIPGVTPFSKGDFAILRAYGLYKKLNKIKYANFTMYSRISPNIGPEDRCVIFHIIISGINQKCEELNSFQRTIFNSYLEYIRNKDNNITFNDDIKAF